MGLINLPKAKQTQNNGGCLRRIIVIAVVAFVAYYLMKSCGGGGVIDIGNPFDTGTTTSTESTTNTNSNTSTTTSTGTTTTTPTPNYSDYSWIVGTWSCEMGAYGTVVMRFEGDGTSGRCAERLSDGSYKYGTYQVNNDVLSYRLEGESIPKKISIEPGKKLLDESGSYYRKK